MASILYFDYTVQYYSSIEDSLRMGSWISKAKEETVEPLSKLDIIVELKMQCKSLSAQTLKAEKEK